jgi:hypothetical protein
MADSQTFQNIDPAKWQRIKDQIKAKAGIEITTDAGIASEKGVKLAWGYNSAGSSLSVTLVSRAFYDPKTETIDADIAQWIASA